MSKDVADEWSHDSSSDKPDPARFSARHSGDSETLVREPGRLVTILGVGL